MGHCTEGAKDLQFLSSNFTARHVQTSRFQVNQDKFFPYSVANSSFILFYRTGQNIGLFPDFGPSIYPIGL